MKIFKKVLRDPTLRKPFQTFLEQQFCSENLNFYIAVEQFKEQNFNISAKAVDRANMARKIFERYFAQNSTEPVNIDNSTSKKIRETIEKGVFPRNTFDVAQYQILHLLKYDCWPRFVRSGGNQPDFTDDELAEEEERQRRIELGEENDSISKHSTPPPLFSSANKPTLVEPIAAISSDVKKTPYNENGKDKRKSILWHGLDRFSRKLRKGDSSTLSSSQVPQSKFTDEREENINEEPRRSYSTELDGSREKIENKKNANTGRSVIGSAGSKRRHIFATGGKQFSMPAEMCSNSSTPSPTRVSRPVEPKFCHLMTGDNFSTELITLSDPTISVRVWTKQMALNQGLDQLSIEAVDAETSSTIDPARQAIDALQSRSVRLVPVIYFLVEILPPNYSFKNPTMTPSKIVVVRTRQSLSVGAVLRPLLGKYFIDFTSLVAVLHGTMEIVKNSISVGQLLGKNLLVMNKSQHNEKLASGKKDGVLWKEIFTFSPSMINEYNLQFHQHGDISHCELSLDNEKNKFQPKDNSFSLLNKFVRKASQAVSSKEESNRSFTTVRKKSVVQVTAGVYCGEDQNNDRPSTSSQAKHNNRKRLSIFKNKEKEPEREKETQPVLLQDDDAQLTPAIFSSKICDETNDSIGGWQPAAYV